MTPPSAEQQILFLQQVQRLFTEGAFSSTYKYALVLALSELAVEHGDDSGDALDLKIIDIGEKFAQLYWRQLAPYSSGRPQTKAGILLQNHGNQAAVVQQLQTIYESAKGNMGTARNLPQWEANIRAVAKVVRQMPLHHLQILGGRLVPFLYEYPLPSRATVVRLKPGVAYNLRRYQGLIQQLARSGWVERVRDIKQNGEMLGQIDDLEPFMFGSARAQLHTVAEVLAPMQEYRCFYCLGRLDGRGEVDHFIPWTRYPRDTSHNFVLAHRTCNNNKQDMLAARPHLERWMERMHSKGTELGEALTGCGFVTDQGCSAQVALWAYRQGVEAGGMGWLAKGQFQALTSECLTILA
jgi:5-methylcytosine-specific restriction endonuclease McrA